MADELRTSWKPKHGSRVRVVQTAEQVKAAEPAPPGVWWAIDHAPTAGHWWLAPHDETAKLARARFGNYLSVHASHLRPA